MSLPRHAPAGTLAGFLLPALFIGVLAGTARALLISLARYRLHRFTHTSVYVVWSSPVASAFVVGAAGLLCWALWRKNPGRHWPRAIGVYAFTATWGLLLLATRLHPLARVVLALGVGMQAARLLAPRRDAVVAAARRSLPVVAVVLLLLALGTSAGRALHEKRSVAALPAADTTAPNILLLILDTVRSLDLGVYGYSRPTTPEMSRFAARGAVFDHAIAPAPWTLPSHASIFTGRPASDLSTGWTTPLDGAFPTLAEALRARGYLTAGFVGNLHYTTAESGLARGFDHYADYRVTPTRILLGSSVARWIVTNKQLRDLFGFHEEVDRVHGHTIRDEFHAWLDGARGRPWFAFLNFYDAHNPYLPSAPYDTAFIGRRVPDSARGYDLLQEAPVSPAQAQGERDAYDQAILELDHEVGTLLRDLEAAGRLRNTIVVITSDHGEEFGEHGLLSHGNTIYLPSLHVPLIIVQEGRIAGGRRIAPTVSLTDLPATLLELSGGPAALPGHSLAGMLMGTDSAERAPAVSEVRRSSGQPAWFPVSRGDLHSVVSDDAQLIRTADSLEVWDLRADPVGTTPGALPPGRLSKLRAFLPLQRR